MASVVASYVPPQGKETVLLEAVTEQRHLFGWKEGVYTFAHNLCILNTSLGADSAVTPCCHTSSHDYQ